MPKIYLLKKHLLQQHQEQEANRNKQQQDVVDIHRAPTNNSTSNNSFSSSNSLSSQSSTSPNSSPSDESFSSSSSNSSTSPDRLVQVPGWVEAGFGKQKFYIGEDLSSNKNDAVLRRETNANDQPLALIVRGKGKM